MEVKMAGRVGLDWVITLDLVAPFATSLSRMVLWRGGDWGLVRYEIAGWKKADHSMENW
jgi:hypothetical protein